jgi:hypothetical protein
MSPFLPPLAGYLFFLHKRLFSSRLECPASSMGRRGADDELAGEHGQGADAGVTLVRMIFSAATDLL